ncbi:hypothetical protein A2W14_04780 [Candidatus Gottesmanbacteria bacterium RBG_16_37_8]|uniref:Uncharacterized protein n=1 Tax=Candidatus Gottesmanbacteria bacterium RBG_16_37_8 TaxID=1798371 RepID=A0A1F5YUH3_9BACT|nr:MAG: hypothetical protein A2W14_04780 [Candidatus Gottesmanbacteria bacterium RBG_16_37_8]
MNLEAMLPQENSPIPTNIQNPLEFLTFMKNFPGQLRKFLDNSPQMKALFTEVSEKGKEFRRNVFLPIHDGLLRQPGMSSAEIFGLYENADSMAFFDTLKSNKNLENMNITDQDGLAWFKQLDTAIRLSHDVAYWALQPASQIENFNKSLELFQQEYSKNGIFSNQSVDQALKAYESTLITIRRVSHNYIPPALIAYSANGSPSEWDIMSEEFLLQQLGLHPEGTDNLNAKLYLKLAKAKGIALGVIPELLAGSKKTPQKNFLIMNSEINQLIKKGFIQKLVSALKNWFNPPSGQHPPPMSLNQVPST